VLAIAQLRGEEVAGRARARKRGAGAQRLGQLSPRDFGRCLQLREARRAKSECVAEILPIGADQQTQGLEFLEYLAREVERRAAAGSGAPLASSFSRGRSSTGQSFIAMAGA
jgi:hypothetical protein